MKRREPSVSKPSSDEALAFLPVTHLSALVRTRQVKPSELTDLYLARLEKYDAVYRNARSHAEVLLLFPRSKVHDGDVAAVEAFKKVGRDLLDKHVLFDVLPDDLAAPGRL